MWSTLRTWELPVTLAEVQEACETCVFCLQKHPQRSVGTTGQVVRGWVPLAWWQVDVIGPLPSSEGYKCTITCMDTASGLLAAYPARHPDQKAVIAALEPFCAAYGQPLIVETDQGTCFTGALVQQWARDLKIDWKFHVAYCPQTARIIE